MDPHQQSTLAHHLREQQQMLLQQQQHHAQQQQLVASSSVHHSHFPGQLHIGAMPLQLSNLGTEHHALQLAQSQAWGTPHGRAPSLQFSQHYQAAAHSPYLHESLSHSAILSAALSDPTGSLSHIDISLLGGLAQQPISGMPNPVITQPMTSSIQMVKSETQSKSGGDNEMQQGAGFVSVVSSTPTSQQDSKGHLNTAASDVVHPEVGDIIGDGDMSHEGVIAHFKNYSMNVGFSMTRNFDNLDSKGRYRRVRVACKQGGLPRKTAKHENPALQRERTSQKVGCPFEVTIWRTKQRPGGLQSTQEEWVVTNVKGVNHGPCTLLGNTYHPLSKTHDGIHKDVQVEIKARLKANQQAAIVASAGLVSSPSSPSPNVHAEQSNMSPDTRLSAGDSALLHQEGENYPWARPRSGTPVSLARFISSKSMEFPGQEGTQLLVLLSEIATAGKRITDLLASAKAWGNLELEQLTTLASDAMQSAVLSTGFAQSYASVDKVEPKIGSGGGCYTVLVDPLNGATPADAAVACGTIFGIYRAPQIGSPDPAPFYSGAGCQQEGRKLAVAGYLLYASATMLVLTFGDGVYGFTLERQTGDFVLTDSGLKTPSRGHAYSAGDSVQGDWPEWLKHYVMTISHGDGQTSSPYSARCTGSLIADFHRTLIHGGILFNPGHFVSLAHQANPLSMIMEQAGGKATDGKTPILQLKVSSLRVCTPIFFGSAEDMSELRLYHPLPEEGN